MKRKTKARLLPVFVSGFLLSVFLIGAVLCVFGLMVKNSDQRGSILIVLLFVSLLPGCMLYPAFVQRKLRLKGLLCGLICGAVLSVLYFILIAAVMNFHFIPLLWLLLPAGIATAVCSGIFSANFFRS